MSKQYIRIPVPAGADGNKALAGVRDALRCDGAAWGPGGIGELAMRLADSAYVEDDRESLLFCRACIQAHLTGIPWPKTDDGKQTLPLMDALAEIAKVLEPDA